MASDRKAAQAVGKSVRACDNCVRRRARWYCAADDAFLCESCDSSVHSANPLARRHERVRLKFSSSSENNPDDESKAGAPTWQEGFTRKARTPRRQKKNGGFPVGVVPEEEACSEEENEEQLLYRVPVFDVERNFVDGGGINGIKSESDGGFARETDGFGGNIPSELDLDEFAADVESLLGKGLDDDLELGLGIFGQGDEECFLRIKDEDEVIGGAAAAEGNLLQFNDLGSEGFELNFDSEMEEEEEDENKRRIRENKALLKLDYDRVMSAWDYRKSPWTTGERPEFKSGDWWPDYYSGASDAILHAYGGHTAVAVARGAGTGDGGREARVSRYREKRRTRLFSKKIRYEVRKLNAEKRPRMKGRFVKRASFAAAASAFSLLNKN